MTNSSCKLFLGLELTSCIQAADDSKRTDSPAEHSTLSEIVSLVIDRMLLIRACRICERSVKAQLLSMADTMKTTRQRYDGAQTERRHTSAL